MKMTGPVNYANFKGKIKPWWLFIALIMEGQCGRSGGHRLAPHPARPQHHTRGALTARTAGPSSAWRPVDSRAGGEMRGDPRLGSCRADVHGSQPRCRGPVLCPQSRRVPHLCGFPSLPPSPRRSYPDWKDFNWSEYRLCFKIARNRMGRLWSA